MNEFEFEVMVLFWYVIELIDRGQNKVIIDIENNALFMQGYVKLLLK